MKFLSAFLFLALVPSALTRIEMVAHPKRMPKPPSWDNSTLDYDYHFPSPQAVKFCGRQMSQYLRNIQNPVLFFLKYTPAVLVPSVIVPYLENITADICNTHYKLFNESLQNRFLNECFNNKYHGAPFRSPYCTYLEVTDTKHDTRFPEFAALRANYTELVTKFHDKEADTALAHSCFTLLLQGNWTQGNCTEFHMTPVYPVKSNFTERETFRWKIFEDLLKTACSNSTNLEASSKLCAVFNQKQANDCYFAPVKNSFCKAVQHGLHKATKGTDLQYYAKLHTLYHQLKRQSDTQHGLLLDCFENHRTDKAEKCKGINWDRRQASSQMEAKTFALYDRLTKLPVPKSANSTTTVVPKLN